MIYVDSCVPMYLVGTDHVNRQRVIELLPRLTAAHEKFVTSAKTFQEIIHRYKGIQRLEALNLVYGSLEEMVEATEDVRKEDVDHAKTLAFEYRKLSSRDCLHVAVMRRIGCDRVWTYDEGFTKVPGIVVLG